jgi:hypothetical protein
MNKFDATFQKILEDLGTDSKLSNLKKKLDKSAEDSLNSGIEDKTTETDLNKTNTVIKKKKLQQAKQKALTGGI